MNAPLSSAEFVHTPAANFIANRWVPAASGQTLPVIDPATGVPFAAIARGVAADIDAAVCAAATAREGAWGALTPVEKGRLLAKLSRTILDHADELALLEATDHGIATAGEGSIAASAEPAGFYVTPTLLRDVPATSRLACEEVFGPVLAAMPFKDDADAVRLANGTPFGLVAGVWTRDGGRQLRMARALRSGQVFINNYGAGGGVELPFGGVKRSGYGREKGFEALYGFTVLKTVVLQHG